jgi:hypothetical protein
MKILVNSFYYLNNMAHILAPNTNKQLFKKKLENKRKLLKYSLIFSICLNILLLIKCII